MSAEQGLKQASIPTIVKFRMMHTDQSEAPAANNAGKKDKNKKDKQAGKQQEAKKDKAPTETKVEPIVERKAPVIAHPDSADFGDLALVQSKYKTDRVWVDFAALDESLIGQNVWLRGRLHTCRAKGNLAFLVMRRGFYTVQAVAFGGGGKKELLSYASKIPTESIVDIYGQVSKPKDPIKSTTQSAVEIQIAKIYCVNASNPVLPFQLEDASRPDPEAQAKIDAREGKADGKKEEEKQIITVGTDLRLDNRWIDLRTPANHAIFRIQSRVCQFYRAYFVDKGFVEIHTPKITPGVSEGGADVFRLDYFGSKACLAQSPQLYKQMAVLSDLFKVFEIGHVFRAENSHTHRHMNEFIGLDFEMEIKEHYTELLDVLGGMLVYVFDKLNEHCKGELSAIQRQYPYEPLVYPKKTLVFHFTEAIKMLREAGEEIGDMEDLSTPQEKKLGKLVKAKYNTDFYIVDKYPITVRPFYTMPCPDDPRYTNSYDVFLRGEEITSGAQRIHDLELLKKRATECKIPHNNITKYLESFRYGAWPHGGAGIGLERVVMLFLGLDNIRKTCMFPRTPNRLEP